MTIRIILALLTPVIIALVIYRIHNVSMKYEGDDIIPMGKPIELRKRGIKE